MDFSAMNRAVSAVFSETVTIEGLGDVPAIFDSRHYADLSGEAGGSTLETSITVTDAVAADIDLEATIIIARGVRYIVPDKQPLGEGMTLLVLWKAP